MEKINFKGWTFEVDKELTQKEYSKIKSSSSEDCSCDHCLNYKEYRKNIFPDEIKSLLNQLGIDENKEVEISHMGKLENGLHYYSGRFHFVGNYKGKDCKIAWPSGDGFTMDLTKITKSFGIGFTKGNDLSQFESNQELVQVEFECEIPWVIDKKLETS